MPASSEYSLFWTVPQPPPMTHVGLSPSARTTARYADTARPSTATTPSAIRRTRSLGRRVAVTALLDLLDRLAEAREADGAAEGVAAVRALDHEERGAGHLVGVGLGLALEEAAGDLVAGVVGAPPLDVQPEVGDGLLHELVGEPVLLGLGALVGVDQRHELPHAVLHPGGLGAEGAALRAAADEGDRAE